MRFFDNLLVTAARRAAYMEDKELISLPAGVDGEDEVAEFCADLANGYLSQSSESFDEYIEKRLLEKYKVEEHPPVRPSKNPDERIQFTVHATPMAMPQYGMKPIHRVVWEALFGEHGSMYALQTDGGEGCMFVPKDGNLDKAWIYYDDQFIREYLEEEAGDVLTPEYMKTLCPFPELMTDKVCDAMLEALKNAG